jgi:hypothetical protein
VQLNQMCKVFIFTIPSFLIRCTASGQLGTVNENAFKEHSFKTSSRGGIFMPFFHYRVLSKLATVKQITYDCRNGDGKSNVQRRSI